MEATHGPNHPDTAISLDNLAGSLQNLGRAGEAEPLVRRALAIMEATLDPNHPYVAIIRNNLADILTDVAQSEAETVKRRGNEATQGPG